ncbi:uncharacterized protein SPPG_03661 [Spizellomyces punctatus DAOM BR117]|uniref:Uncharacterized protein n=1 Tax=Spizellomyces punctatus (strain DAOM BR117) TaxID=645134 RepID=A0A0L0HK85_SPIPD|nr:uncharacterized protein SPPG_03661 [Spizellomyces punctatus DAOM BR117]KND01871.1 hypothetical protein SPPG_03661 [Spizellomyces punctatus DAOM BR117]|eukprot:XP_016609910.1 hypothetical protein SPPG_03661 [Spizellomyces punctatus DAOM BR117]
MKLLESIASTLMFAVAVDNVTRALSSVPPTITEPPYRPTDPRCFDPKRFPPSVNQSRPIMFLDGQWHIGIYTGTKLFYEWVPYCEVVPMEHAPTRGKLPHRLAKKVEDVLAKIEETRKRFEEAAAKERTAENASTIALERAIYSI